MALRIESDRIVKVPTRIFDEEVRAHSNPFVEKR